MDKEKALERLKAIEDETKELRKIIDNPNIVYPEGLIMPEKGDKYFVLISNSTDSWIYDDDSDDKNTECCGNIYSTREAVEKADERRIIATSIKRYIAEINHAEDWVCDWKDMNQAKEFPGFSHNDCSIKNDFSLCAQNLDKEWHTYRNGWDKVRKKFTDKEIAFAVWGIEID